MSKLGTFVLVVWVFLCGYAFGGYRVHGKKVVAVERDLLLKVESLEAVLVNHFGMKKFLNCELADAARDEGQWIMLVGDDCYLCTMSQSKRMTDDVAYNAKMSECRCWEGVTDEQMVLHFYGANGWVLGCDEGPKEGAR